MVGSQKPPGTEFVARLRSIALIAVVLLAWQIAVHRRADHLLPDPLQVARGFFELAQHGLLLKYIVASLFRVSWGFSLAMLIAIPAGLAIGWNCRAEMTLNPLLQILRPISPLAWIPIAILWFGVGDMAAIFLIFMASLLPLTITAISAVEGVPIMYVNAARNFGLSRTQLIYLVLYPAVLPRLIVGIRITIGIAWTVVVAAEMIAVNSGLGFLIVDARNAGNRYDLVAAAMITIGLIGLLIDTWMRSMEPTRSPRWRY